MSTVLTEERLFSLADAANLAPSADNDHVVRLLSTGERLQLLATDDLLRSDPTRRVLGLMSAGAVAENLMLRGRRLGLDLQPHWLPQPDRPALLAEFDARPAPPTDDPLEAAIPRRHTNRRLRFRGPPLDDAAQRALSAQAAAVPGTALRWLDAPDARRQALRLIRRAEAERFRNPALHAELFGSIRFDVGWHAGADRGLPPGSLELPWVERPAFALMRHWPVQRLANALGAHAFVGWRGADLPCRMAPHLAAITVDTAATVDGDAAALQAGRLLQRVWLHAAVLGLGFQVFAASPLYALPGSTAIDPALRDELAAGWRAINPAARPYIVFRLGRAPAPSVRAGRPDAQRLRLGAAAETPAERVVS
jgi:hypothetical protein